MVYVHSRYGSVTSSSLLVLYLPLTTVFVTFWLRFGEKALMLNWLVSALISGKRRYALVTTNYYYSHFWVWFLRFFQMIFWHNNLIVLMGAGLQEIGI